MYVLDLLAITIGSDCGSDSIKMGWLFDGHVKIYIARFSMSGALVST
jgi:hypothetical protein